MSELVIREATGDVGALAERILRALPDWFGIEESLLEYVADARVMPTWEALLDGESVGFVTVKRHVPGSWEVHCLAVLRPTHGRGVGRALVARVEDEARRAGQRMIHVKTMGPSRPNAEYAATLRFYEAIGFVALEERMDIWGKTPCLFLAKAL
jgi:GNAT superfamily N-acetyltransferase